jgi:hypothetical protein
MNVRPSWYGEGTGWRVRDFTRDSPIEGTDLEAHRSHRPNYQAHYLPMARAPVSTDARRHRSQEPGRSRVDLGRPRLQERTDAFGHASLLGEGGYLLRRRLEQRTSEPPRMAAQRTRTTRRRRTGRRSTPWRDRPSDSLFGGSATLSRAPAALRRLGRLPEVD